jgi:hypothetical protein
MRLLNEKYTDTPYYGIRRMTAWLRSERYTGAASRNHREDHIEAHNSVASGYGDH